jgi:hypothetical protein
MDSILLAPIDGRPWVSVYRHLRKGRRVANIVPQGLP